jgi:hypothetical protein
MTNNVNASQRSNEDAGEIVVRLSEEIDAITAAGEPEDEQPDEVVRSLIRELSSGTRGASDFVISGVDVFLADEAFHGTIYDDSGGKPASRMSPGMVAAIIRGADKAVEDRQTEATSDALTRFYDELDAKLPGTDRKLQEVLTGKASTPESIARDAGNELATAVKSLEYGNLVPSNDPAVNNVIVVDFGRLVKQTKINARVAYEAISEAAGHARSLYAEHHHPPQVSAAGGRPGSPGRPDWDGFLERLRQELGIDDDR